MRGKKYVVANKYLTQTEVRIIILDMYCYARKEIAHLLGSSPHTVKTHIQNIYRKLGINGHRDLQRFGFDNGFYNAGFFENEYLFDGFDNLPWEEAA